MKIAVVGLGGMGRNHVRVLNRTGKLAAICDEKTAALKEHSDLGPGVLRTGSLEELLTLTEFFDAAVVAVPTPYHLDVASKLIQAKKPVLIEKPLASNAKEAEALKTLSREHKTKVACGYIERFNPVVSKLIELCRNDYFGEITSVNIKRVGGSPRSATNVVEDLMTHDLDILSEIFEIFPKSCSVHTGSTRDGVVDFAQVLLKFDNASATCESNWLSPIKIRKIQITGTKGYVEADLIKQELVKFTGLNERSTHKQLEIESFNAEALELELNAFCDYVENKESRIMNVVEATDILWLTNEVMNDNS